MNEKRFWLLVLFFIYLLYVIWLNVRIFWLITIFLLSIYYFSQIKEWLKDEKVDT